MRLSFELRGNQVLMTGLAMGLLLALLAGPAGCAPKTESEAKVVVTINDCSITLGEFRSRLAHEVSLYHDFVPDQASKRTFLKELIRKEILIQEARNLKLDRSAKFIKTIERYWEATLIRTLLELKAEQLCTQVYVSKEEIRNYYDQMDHPATGAPPLAELEENIIRVLKEKKKTDLMAEWMAAIEAQATVTIDEGLLSVN